MVPVLQGLGCKNKRGLFSCRRNNCTGQGLEFPRTDGSSLFDEVRGLGLLELCLARDK